ncbi:hypothetical protein DICPUDRAFT_44338 [Dictyostelium purpureum]|uniref:Dickkopf N-terminal cysteine-rich domain-containing protein n=1 Tax=Dictyostelium purpureum TaxID=5786 RepID=F1A616_DICPU|nr:uncharacterized protein DICPUDRAFT_44338 [Dictyostelium purpureum]EGC28363.1 hypothetical protein DICPUDRAFT_44338 [Dictyostelium purpureum]|eukprot:XP_003295110.1 hypothetical protein DICPUDRAFT_44338 [Dictyostelium purpureum]
MSFIVVSSNGFKLLLFLLLSTIVCYVKSSFIDLDSLSCSLNICSKLGEPCEKQNILGGLQCYVQDRCFNGTCVESLPEGSICKNSADCLVGYSCLSTNSGNGNNIKTCQKSFYVEYGGACNISFDCLNGLECIGSKCITPLTGCLSDVQCDKDSICDNGECVKYNLNENECFIYRTLSCKNSFLPCSLKSFNQSSVGQCRDVIPEGNPCLVNKYSCDWNVGQYCKPLEQGSILGECTRTPSNTLNPCKSVNDCKEYEFCKCDPKSGVGYCLSRGTYIGSYCREAAKVFMQCFAKTNCTEPFSINPLSCVYQYCKEEASCMSLYCTEPMLPISPCVNTHCSLSFFKPNDLHFLSKSHKTVSTALFFYIIPFFLIFI